MLFIKYAELAEKGYSVIKIIVMVFSIMFVIVAGMSMYKNMKEKQYLSELDNTALEFIETIEVQILEIAEHSNSYDIDEINTMLEEVNGVELITNKKNNIVFIQLDNSNNDERWDMEVNWQYGTTNLSVVVYDPTNTYMWSNHFPKERFEVY